MTASTAPMLLIPYHMLSTPLEVYIRQEAPSEGRMFQVQQSCSAQMVGNHLFQCRKVSLGPPREWRQQLPQAHQCQKMIFSMAKDNSQKIGPRVQKTYLKSAKNQRQQNLIPCTLILVLYTQLRINSVLPISCFLLWPMFLLVKSVLPTFFYLKVVFLEGFGVFVLIDWFFS